MELVKIEQLLEKYFEAETTVLEEKSLQKYFMQDQVAAHLEKYRPLFQHFTHTKQEVFEGNTDLNLQANTSDKSLLYKWLSVAAVGLLIFGIYFGKQYQEEQEAQYAYEETKKALDLLAQNFNRGTKKVAYLNQFEVTKQKIYNKK